MLASLLRNDLMSSLPLFLPPFWVIKSSENFWLKCYTNKRQVAEWPQYSLGCRTSSGFSRSERTESWSRYAPMCGWAMCVALFKVRAGEWRPSHTVVFPALLWSLDAVCRRHDKKTSVPLLVSGGHPHLYLMRCQACLSAYVFDWVQLGYRLRSDEVKPRWPLRSSSASAYTLCFLSF